jgi:putative transposase
MSQRAATITSLPMAFEVVKAMQADGLDWGEGYRPLGRQALAEIIEDQMAATVDRYLDQLQADDAADRRNGYYRRHLLTELGDIELDVPRTRRYSPTEVIRAYARRTREIDRVILAGFVLGLSTRKVGETLLALLGRSVSPSTVSQVAKTLDAAVAAFHRRPLQDRYQALMLDGVVLARKTGAGALRRPVLVALGLRHDGKKEIIDFRLAASESAAEWEKFLTDLYRRGLTGEGLDMICVDGGAGLLAALPTILPGIAVQRCWAHYAALRIMPTSAAKPAWEALIAVRDAA